MDQNSCQPKTVVGDMAFFTPSFMTFYQSHGIKPLPTGPRTPWPNRAETAVRLFKRQFNLLLNYVQLDKKLANISVGQLVKRTVWARNNQLTIGGYTPLELAFGRRPPDLLDAETESPEELTTDPLTTDKLDRVVRKLALKAHLEARQAEDLRLDLSRNVRPSDGPFSEGDRVFFFDKDPSKIKDTGRWVRGKVLVQTGAMVTIETTTGVVKVNETKVRKDHDEWHDVPTPLKNDPTAGDERPSKIGSDGQPLKRLKGKTTPKPVSSAQADTGSAQAENVSRERSSGSNDPLDYGLWLIT
jgi:hypothetical protein